MKKDFLLLGGSVVLTVAMVLGMIHWLAPDLLGRPTDMQLVQLDEKVPAFYDGVFRDTQPGMAYSQLKDPLTRIRNQPLQARMSRLGPHDIMGFRNREVPVVADIVTIGDSMTYGNNVYMEQNWPHQLAAHLQLENISVYNMSTGGWAAVQYLDMFNKALKFKPHIVVVAFYSGNDPLETFAMVYGNDNWGWLKPDRTLSAADAPRVTYPAPESDQWSVDFQDGVAAIFTPELRLASNQDHPAVHAGYAVMSSVAERISNKARESGVKVLFTVIPTKELVYAKKVQQEGLEIPPAYAALVKQEADNIERVAAHIRALPDTYYVDVVAPLQTAGLGPTMLYADTINGHPEMAGYTVIGETLSKTIDALLPRRPRGLYAQISENEFSMLLINDEGLWYFNSQDIIEQNGWPAGTVATIDERDIVNIPFQGIITSVDPARFGPACCNAN